MADMISRAAALDAIDGIKPMRGNMEQLAMKALCWAAVKTIQPVEAVPVVHGRWYEIRDYSQAGLISFECSECGRLCITLYKYCPQCGAKMDGERRDDDETGND